MGPFTNVRNVYTRPNFGSNNKQVGIGRKGTRMQIRGAAELYVQIYLTTDPAFGIVCSLQIEIHCTTQLFQIHSTLFIVVRFDM